MQFGYVLFGVRRAPWQRRDRPWNIIEPLARVLLRVRREPVVLSSQRVHPRQFPWAPPCSLGDARERDRAGPARSNLGAIWLCACVTNWKFTRIHKSARATLRLTTTAPSHTAIACAMCQDPLDTTTERESAAAARPPACPRQATATPAALIFAPPRRCRRAGAAPYNDTPSLRCMASLLSRDYGRGKCATMWYAPQPKSSANEGSEACTL